MQKIKKKTVIKILVVIGAILILRWYSNPERRIFAMVERNLEKYEITAQQMLNGEISASGVDVPGVRDIHV